MSIFEDQSQMLKIVESFRKADGSLPRNNNRHFMSDGEDYLMLMNISENEYGMIKVVIRIVKAVSFFVICEYSTKYEYLDAHTGIVPISPGIENGTFNLFRGTIEDAEHLLMLVLLSK